MLPPATTMQMQDGFEPQKPGLMWEHMLYAFHAELNNTPVSKTQGLYEMKSNMSLSCVLVLYSSAWKRKNMLFVWHVH